MDLRADRQLPEDPDQATGEWLSLLEVCVAIGDPTDRMLHAIALVELGRFDLAAKQLRSTTTQSRAEARCAALFYAQIALSSADPLDARDAGFVCPEVVAHLRSCSTMHDIDALAFSAVQPEQLPAVDLRTICLIAAGRWRAMVNVLTNGGPTEQLVGAFLAGAHLAADERQVHLLDAAASAYPLLAAEALVDLHLARAPEGDQLEAALRQRDSLIREALSVQQLGYAIERGVLAPESTAEAAGRASSGEDMGERRRWLEQRHQRLFDSRLHAEHVLELADGMPAYVSASLRLYAALILMRTGEHAKAISCCRHAEQAELRSLQRLLWLVCVGASEQPWQALCELAEGSSRDVDRLAYLTYALALTWHQPAELETLIPRMEGLTAQANRKSVRLMASSLLVAMYRRLGDGAAALERAHLMVALARSRAERSALAFAALVQSIAAGPAARKIASSCLAIADEGFPERLALQAVATAAGLQEPSEALLRRAEQTPHGEAHLAQLALARAYARLGRCAEAEEYARLAAQTSRPARVLARRLIEQLEQRVALPSPRDDEVTGTPSQQPSASIAGGQAGSLREDAVAGHRQPERLSRVKGLLDEARQVHAPSLRIARLLAAARLCEKIPLEVERAIAIYNEVLSVGASAKALAALSRIYEALERWECFLETSEQLLHVEADGQRRAMLLFKCGSVLETQFRQNDRAREYYQRAVDASSRCLPAVRALGAFSARQRDWTTLKQMLLLEARLWKKPRGKADVLARVGELYESKLADVARAREYWLRALSVDPHCPRATVALFYSHASTGDIDEALRFGERCAEGGAAHLRQPADRVRFFLRYSDVLTTAQKWAEAGDALAAALAASPVDHDGLLALLMFCSDGRGDRDFTHTVTGSLNAAMAARDDRALGLVAAVRGITAGRDGDFETARVLLESALTQPVARAPVIGSLCSALVVMDEAERAVELASRCRFWPNGDEEWVRASYWLAEFWLYHARRAGEAACLYAELARWDSTGDLADQLVVALVADGQVEPAFREAQLLCDGRARAKAPVGRLARAYQLLGTAARRSGRDAVAKASWYRACEMAPNSPDPHLALARLLNEQGDVEGAERELTQADQATDRTEADVLRARAELYGIRGRTDSAIKVYRKLCRRAQSHPDQDLVDDRVGLARWLSRRGDHDEAIVLLRAAVADSPAYAPSYEALHELFQRAGRPRQARRAVQVWCAASGSCDEHGLRPTALRAVGTGGWTRLTRALRGSPIHQLLCIASRFGWTPGGEIDIDEAECLDTHGALEELTTALQQPARVFRAPALRVPMVTWEANLYLSPQSLDLPEAVRRAMLAVGLSVVRLGYGGVLDVSLAGREHLRQVLLPLIDCDGGNLPSLPARLSRREQRHLAQLRRRLDPVDIRQEIDHWRAALDQFWSRLCLLLTEDYVSCVAALEAIDCQTASVADLSHGWLGAVERAASLAAYYVSDAVEEDLATIERG